MKMANVCALSLSFLGIFHTNFEHMQDLLASSSAMEPAEGSLSSNYAPLLIGIISLFVLAVFTISRYGNFREQPWYVSAVCIVGWCFPFWIVLLLPVDIASVNRYKAVCLSLFPLKVTLLLLA